MIEKELWDLCILFLNNADSIRTEKIDIDFDSNSIHDIINCYIDNKYCIRLIFDGEDYFYYDDQFEGFEKINVIDAIKFIKKEMK